MFGPLLVILYINSASSIPLPSCVSFRPAILAIWLNNINNAPLAQSQMQQSDNQYTDIKNTIFTELALLVCMQQLSVLCSSSSLK